MDKITYELLFITICIGVGVYINRKSFTGFVRTVMGVPMPSYIISAALSIILGLIFYAIVHLILWQFRSPFV